MASKANLVNLDAMIKRSDFASKPDEDTTFDTIHNISVRDLGDFTAILRKPDFQRETNHWSPEQVTSLLESFVSGDLIPSVILWKSSSFLFVIDGGHRLSVLRSWVEDDYGDGLISLKYFGGEISKEQKATAEKTRILVNSKVGSWADFNKKKNDEDISDAERAKISTILTRGLSIQWVKGDVDKAETSFFNINMKGTALDDVEELLLRNRKKPTSIAARAVIRAGKGHKYWSSFSVENSAKIEKAASELHSTLFDPDLKRPVKTLDLPLGGSRGVRIALQLLIDFILVANQNSQGNPKSINEQLDDDTGNDTVQYLQKATRLANRITGNDNGSLGLHPAVYFYGPTGRHSSPMFLGTVSLIAKKISANDSGFFRKFTSVRQKLEDILVSDKDLIATIMQKHVSGKRVEKYSELLSIFIDKLSKGEDVSESIIIEESGLQGKVVAGNIKSSNKSFSDDNKSQVFIISALKSAIKCPICNGYLDSEKSISYDHIVRAQDGGKGDVHNCQLTHPYCNMSIKN
ncbi:GmrSD restriction endonuclease domain-containing protein [Pectobacterium carotovorum]|uniref:GmrSD restriction endonuclease domain-containing protein n=1 Tax=Pectobacterium carotovorum TaxID=554 RepID=UPI003017024B